MFGIDHSSTPPDPALLKRNHVGFVCRYLSWDPKKNISRQEADALKRAGLGIVLVWETTANRALDGQQAGAADATAAAEQAIGAGLTGAPIYFAVDFDASASQLVQVKHYLSGATSVLGIARVGVYGSFYVVGQALTAKVCTYAWQTYAWSGGTWDGRAHIRQYLNGQPFCGIDVDYDHSMFPDFGQAVKPPVPPRPTWRYPANPKFWLWARWRLGEGEFVGHGFDPKYRPNVPKLISPLWLAALERFVKARSKK
jgi:hypothetical protein